VFFIPVSRETYREDELPDHPSMARVSNCEQPLSTRYSRRLITYQKAAPYDAATATAWRESRRGFVMAIEQVADLVWETRPERQARGEGSGAGGPKARRQNSGGGGGGGGGSGGEGGVSEIAAVPVRELAGARI